VSLSLGRPRRGRQCDTIWGSVPRVLTILFRSCMLGAVVLTAACGSKGAPLAPLRPVPAQISDLRAGRLDDTVSLAFTVPTGNADNTRPADLSRVDVFAVSGSAVGPGGRALTPRELEMLTTRVASLEIQPPPLPTDDEDEMGDETPAAATDDSRPVQGSVVTVTEQLTPDMLATEFEHPDAERLARRLAAAAGEDYVADDEQAQPSTAGAGRPLLWPLPPAEPTRTYVALPYSTRNRPGVPSAPLSVPYGPALPAPPAPIVTHTETAFQLTWENPEGLRLPIQRTITEALAAAEDLIVSRPLVTMGPAQTYRVYEMPAEDAPPSAAVGPVNALPIEGTTFEDPRLQFGVPRCYALRAVEQRSNVALESRLSPVTCLTARDIYPPLAPTGLVAVGSEGGISLIWEPSTAADVAGYLVLRGAPGEALRPVVEAPVAEATYRDTTTEAGVMYEYAVVAVDNATPPNVSPESNRVREAAR
jgi:hypothetical protein